MKPSSTSENILLMLLVLLVIGLVCTMLYYEAQKIGKKIQVRTESVVQI